MFNCNECQREFTSERGLNQHIRMSCGKTLIEKIPPSQLNISNEPINESNFIENNDIPQPDEIIDTNSTQSTPSRDYIFSDNPYLSPNFYSQPITREVENHINNEVSKMKNYLSSQVKIMIDSAINDQNKGINSLKETIEVYKNMSLTKDNDIQFLKDEIKSKDAIINILLEQIKNGNNNNPQSEHSKWVQTSTSSKPHKPPPPQNPIPLNNRFDSLNLLPNEPPVAENLYSDSLNTNKPTKRSIYVFSDSIPKRIRPREFNRFCKHPTKFRSFPGVNSKHLNHHVVPSIVDEKPETVLIHCGTNDLQSSLPDQAIASQIINIGKTCKYFGASKIIVSGIVCRADPSLDVKAIES